MRPLFDEPANFAVSVRFDAGGERRMTGYVESLTDPSYRGQILVTGTACTS